MKRPPHNMFSPGLLPGALICCEAMIGGQLVVLGIFRKSKEVLEAMVVQLSVVLMRCWWILTST